MENGSQHTSEPSLAALLGGSINDVKDLLGQELTRTKLEVQDELRKIKTAALTLGIGVGVAAVGGTLLSLMLVHVLEVCTEIPLWGRYGIVGSGLVVLGGVLFAAGKTTAETLAGVPQQAAETRQEPVQGEHRADDSQQDITVDTHPDIEDTRSVMTDGLEVLEERVRETVEDMRSAVEDIVENVKDTVDTTVETVRHTFDVHHQVEQHPWLMFGGVTVVGYLLGSLSSGRSSSAVSTHDTSLSPAGTTAASSRELSAHPQPQQGMGSGVRDRFKDEIAIIEGAVIGAVMSTLWEMLKQALLPPPTPHLTSARTKGDAQPSERPAQTPASLSSAAVHGGAVF